MMSLNDWVGKNKIAGQRVLGIDASRANSSTRTGTEWYAYQVIQGLKKLVPEDIQVVLYSKEPLRDGLEKLPANWESRVLRWPPGRFWTQMRLSWEMLVRPPDVLFVPAHTLPLLTPRKSIITLHDLGFVAVPEAYTWGERLYHRFSAWFAARRACQILTVSNFSRQEFSRLLGVAEERLAVTPLACDRQMFRADFSSDEVEAVVQRYNIDQPYFLFVGRLENKKNLRLLLTAFDEYILGGGKASLVLVGKRGLGADQALVEMNESVRRRVIEVGYVDPGDLPKLYVGAKAFLFPSRYEGFGLPLLEAFACGVPVIASDIASIPEVAGEAAILLNVDDVAVWSEAMKRIADDSELREKLIKAGLERVDDYSWVRLAATTWEVLALGLD